MNQIHEPRDTRWVQVQNILDCSRAREKLYDCLIILFQIDRQLHRTNTSPFRKITFPTTSLMTDHYPPKKTRNLTRTRADKDSRNRGDMQQVSSSISKNISSQEATLSARGGGHRSQTMTTRYKLCHGEGGGHSPPTPPNLLKCNVWVPTWQTSLATEKMVRLQQGQEICALCWERGRKSTV